MGKSKKPIRLNISTKNLETSIFMQSKGCETLTRGATEFNDFCCVGHLCKT